MTRKMTLFLAVLGCMVLFLLVSELTRNTDAARTRILTEACPRTDDLPCLENVITETVSKRGLAEGFRMLKAHYMATPEFRPDCHVLALKVGAALGHAAGDQKLEYTPESVWCNYGFYQAYPEALLMSGATVEYVRTFCNFVGEQLRATVPGVRAECFRGIGRALPFLSKVDQGDPARMAASATQVCKIISPGKDEYANCVSGAFNNLGRAEVAETHGLSVNVYDPLDLCRAQPEDLQGACYGNLHWTSFSLVDKTRDFSESLHAIGAASDTATDRTVLETVWTLGYEEGRKSVAEDDTDVSLISACASLPMDIQVKCIQGISTGFVKHGVPGEQHKRVIEFCAAAISSMPSVQKADCLMPAIGYLRGFYSPSQFQSACREFEKELGVSCG